MITAKVRPEKEKRTRPKEWRIKYIHGDMSVWIKTTQSVERIKNSITFPGVEEVQWRTKSGQIRSIKHRDFKV